MYRPSASKNGRVYVEMSSDFWKAPGVREWLCGEAESVRERVAADPSLLRAVDDLHAHTYDDDSGGALSVLNGRHLSVSEVIGNQEQLPAEAFQDGPVPIPSPSVPRPAEVDLQSVPASVRDNPLLLFLWSLAPWALQGVDLAAEGEGDAEVYSDDEDW